MSFQPRGDRVVLKALVLIAVGVGVGIADAFVLRPINTKATEAPPIEEMLGALGNKPKPAEPTDGPDGEKPKQPAQTPSAPDPKQDPGQTVPPTPQPGPVEQSQPAPQPPKPDDGGSKQPAPTAAMKKNHITLDQAYALYQSDPRGEGGRVVFIDARSMDKYVEGHVAGSYPMGLESFQGGGDPPQLEWLRNSVPDAVFVVYCLGGDCHESEEVALLMNNSGLSKTYIMHDGIPAWQAAGYPVETGEHPFQQELHFR